MWQPEIRGAGALFRLPRSRDDDMTEKFDTGSDELNAALDRLVSHLCSQGYVSLQAHLHDVLRAAGRCPFTLELPGPKWRGDPQGERHP